MPTTHRPTSPARSGKPASSPRSTAGNSDPPSALRSACAQGTEEYKKNVQEESESKSCEAGWKLIVDQLTEDQKKQFRSMKVTSVKIDGDKAVADGEPKDLFDGGQAMRKVDGEWLIDQQ